MTPTEKNIGPYRLLAPIGKGGMGVVWRAEHEETGQIVAVKTIAVPKRGLLRSIRREIQSLARVRHPGVVKIVEEGVHQGLPYYAMEIVEGQTLGAWRAALSPNHRPSKQEAANLLTTTLELNETLPPLEPNTQEKTLVGAVPSAPDIPVAQIVTIVRKLCLALSVLHSEGIIHRDLKPENIIVTADGSPVLFDFGIASAQNTTGREQMTLGERSQQGTIAYMSLEQIQGDPLDARADLYSLGVMFFELLTGRKPFDAETPQAMLWAHYSETPRKPSQFVTGLPEGLDELVLRLLAKERNDRPGYAADVAQMLLSLGAEDDGSEVIKPKTYLYRPGFSGRQKEIEQLRQASIRVRNERGGIFFVEGESGVGKTRFLLELARDLSQRGFAVLLGECREQDSLLPLNVFRKPLQEIADRCVERGKAETERLVGGRAHILSLFEPMLKSAIAATVDQEAQEAPPREEIFAALSQTLLALAQRQPLIILLDDLQWADDLSIGLLDAFLRDEELSRWVFFICAYRTEEIKGPTKKLTQAEHPRLTLGRLGPDAVASMIGDMLALSPPPKKLSIFLSDLSSGNPFFVAEYLRAAVDEKLLRRDQLGRWQVVGLSDDENEDPISGRWQLSGAADADYQRLALPRTLQALVERRLSGLSSHARTALESFAVLGRIADLDLLAWLVPLTEDYFEDAIDELSRRQILEEAGSGKLRFIHEKVRELSYERLTPKARTGLHRAAAEAIEGLYEDPDEHAADLAHHWELAGSVEKARYYHAKISSSRLAQVDDTLED